MNEEIERKIAEKIVDYRMKHRTNADRIRQMTDEELARFIGSISTVDYDPYTRIKGKKILNELVWLQSPVEEGKG